MKQLFFYFLFLLFWVTPGAATENWTDPGPLPDAGNRPAPEHLNIIEARQSIGYPEDLAKDPGKVIRGKIPIVIIDGGFVGIKEFWKKHPDKQKNILSFMTFYEKGKKPVFITVLRYINQPWQTLQIQNTTFSR